MKVSISDGKLTIEPIEEDDVISVIALENGNLIISKE